MFASSSVFCENGTGVTLENVIASTNEGTRPVVYLAGGLRTGWQDQIKLELRAYKCIDPRDCLSSDPAVYTDWDLEAISRCDVVLAYFESDNPTGYALALEVGYAKALNKKVVLVNERSGVMPEFARAIAMVRAAADVYFTTLRQGTEYLRSGECKR
jgi:hypothetical protein